MKEVTDHKAYSTVTDTNRIRTLLLKCDDVLPFEDQKKAYLEFSNVSDAQSWAEDNYSEWAKKHKEIFAASKRYAENSILRMPDPVDMYFGYRFEKINQYLRDTANNPDYALNRDIQNLTLAILSAPVITEKIILYRQVPEDIFNQLIEYGAFVEDGFMSTSLIKSICAEHCGGNQYILKLYVDVARPIHSIYANLIKKRNEMELLLQPQLILRVIGQPYFDTQIDKILCDVLLTNAAYSDGSDNVVVSKLSTDTTKN